jgi:hypothetical protein
MLTLWQSTSINLITTGFNNIDEIIGYIQPNGLELSPTPRSALRPRSVVE